MTDAPKAPVGVTFQYLDGTVLEPTSVDYLGVDDDGMHTWVAHAPRPIMPGLCELRVDQLPGRTKIIGG